MGVNTITKWKKLRAETGSVADKPLKRKWRKIDPEKLQSDANEYPDDFDSERAVRLCCSASGVKKAMLDGLATIRGKKISICLIIQSLAQLDTIYGQNERKVISDTCGYKAILGATDADTQEYFSKGPDS